MQPLSPTTSELAPNLRERIRALIERPRFDQAIIAIIIANAITLGLETSPALAESFGGLLHAFDRAVLAVFVVELLLRLFVYRSRFFHDPWRVFDFVIVGIAPIRKLASWPAKIAALLGYSFPLLLLLLPRSASNVWLDGLSTLLILCGNTACVLAVLSLGRSLSIMPEARKLVTEGLYQRIRHPLYLAEEIAVLGLLLQYRSWQAAAILAVHFVFQLQRMKWEEKVLAEAFPEYTEYCRKSHRLIPGLY